MKNIQIILYLSHLLSLRPGVRLQYVKGHAGVEGNEGADRMAVRGTFLPELPERDWTVPKDDSDITPTQSQGGQRGSQPIANGSVRLASQNHLHDD